MLSRLHPAFGAQSYGVSPKKFPTQQPPFGSEFVVNLQSLNKANPLSRTDIRSLLTILEESFTRLIQMLPLFESGEDIQGSLAVATSGASRDTSSLQTEPTLTKKVPLKPIETLAAYNGRQLRVIVYDQYDDLFTSRLRPFLIDMCETLVKDFSATWYKKKTLNRNNQPHRINSLKTFKAAVVRAHNDLLDIEARSCPQYPGLVQALKPFLLKSAKPQDLE